MKPILFSTPMVRAILDGRKTQTRRTRGLDEINKQPDQVDFCSYQSNEKHWMAVFQHRAAHSPGHVKCPYGMPGEILWVRETFCYDPFDPDDNTFIYGADCNEVGRGSFRGLWKPSIHMPRKAARIFLQISEISVERLNEISDLDAISEGILYCKHPNCDEKFFKDYISDASGYGDPEHDYPTVQHASDSFKTLWQSINGLDSWISNPWVWVVEYKRIENPKTT